MYTSHLLVSSCLVAHMASAGLVRLDKKALYGRRVPHEHAHEKELTSVRGSLFLNNPAGFVDPVFGLLGAAAAAGGANGADPDCLQQLIADQAFTNAKAINDIEGMTAALVYRALERNTGRVGLASPLCTSVQAVNPEVAAVRQHQDASGEGSIALNKQITLELARQIASFGGDPLRAIESGTFAPGDLSDASARGGSCNDLNDPVGCIYTQILLVPDVTPAEIAQAIQNISPGSNNDTAVIDDIGDTNTGGTGTIEKDSACVPPVTVTVTVTAAGATSAPTVPVRQDVPVQGAAVTSVSQAAELVASDIDLGDCPNIALAFGQKLEGRKETSFIPANLQQFPHGSAQNPNIITDFMCDNLVNQCGLKRGDPGHVLCEEAQNAIANLPRHGAAADIFKNFFGIATNFAVVPVFDNQGNLVA